MKALGIVRKVDDLGRIVVPKEVQNAHGWDAKTPIEMFATEDGVFLKAYQPAEEKQEIIDDLKQIRTFVKNEAALAVIDSAIEFLTKG